MWRGQAWSGRKVFDPCMPFRRTKSLSVGAQESEVGPYRLAIVISHPVHYQVPLFRKLAANPEFDLTVYFCSRDGVEHTFDEDFADRKSTRLNSSHGYISYAVFCLKKKNYHNSFAHSLRRLLHGGITHDDSTKVAY